MANGGKVLGITENHVLALFRDQFVVWSWMMNDDNRLECYQGHYFDKDIGEAVDYLRKVSGGAKIQTFHEPTWEL